MQIKASGAMNLRVNSDENKTRWIRVSVESFEHGVLDKGPYDRRSAWLWLIANAAWRDKRINHKGKPLVLKRGQVLAGRKFLAETWGWGEQMVRSFLLMLHDEHMVETNQSNGHFANVITICNYEKYQTASEKEGQSNNQSATSAQPVSNQTCTSSTSYTNKTSSDNSAPRTSREPEVAALPRQDLDQLSDRLLDACNGSLDNPVNCMGLLNLAIPQLWLKNGCDLELDVIPTLTAAGKKHHGKRIRSWDYFTPMVAEAKDRRERGMPAVTAANSAAPRVSAARAILEAMKAREVTT
jgi:hypothetical protein